MNKFNYLPHTDEDRKEMLKAIGVSKQEDLFNNIPSDLKSNSTLIIPEGLSELEVNERILELARKNIWSGEYFSFLGGGYYDRYIPSVINQITSRVEFQTAYTPYQPEISQGTLQAIYEFQSMICTLTGMDVANASMYDGATATAEAVLMACRTTRRNKAIVSRVVNTETQDVIMTYLSGPEIDLVTAPINKDNVTDVNSLKELLDKDVACVVIQNPNYLGSLEEVRKIEKLTHEFGALFIVNIDPISVGLIKQPGTYGADIAVGEGQSLGCSMMLGGPGFGFMACKQKFMRQMPGRIVGQTLDNRGNIAYTLTLQTREQHIRREKATSNICTNQSLCALGACVYLSSLGPQGLKELSNTCFQRAHYLANKIEEIPGFKVATDNFFNEFVIILPKQITEEDFINHMIENKVLPGIPSGLYFKEIPNSILVCVTEKNKPLDLYIYISAVKDLAHQLELD